MTPRPLPIPSNARTHGPHRPHEPRELPRDPWYDAVKPLTRWERVRRLAASRGGPLGDMVAERNAAAHVRSEEEG